jgi:urease accessory protein
MRGERPYVFSNMKTKQGLQPIMNFIAKRGGLAVRAPITAD